MLTIKKMKIYGLVLILILILIFVITTLCMKTRYPESKQVLCALFVKDKHEHRYESFNVISPPERKFNFTKVKLSNNK
ncbi:MAG: hypothetical protein LWY06_06415, partial [Firmicutes bacterium]|nr:hypothetical protein [Bacillota bacterium]